MTLMALFDRIFEQVSMVFEANGGQATLEQIAAVYAKYGLSNENGWEQEQPIYVSGNEVAWPLSFGVRRSEVEELLLGMDPQSIEFHEQNSALEEWQMYPVPETLVYPGDFEDDLGTLVEDEYPGTPPKRVIH